MAELPVVLEVVKVLLSAIRITCEVNRRCDTHCGSLGRGRLRRTAPFTADGGSASGDVISPRPGDPPSAFVFLTGQPFGHTILRRQSGSRGNPRSRCAVIELGGLPGLASEVVWRPARSPPFNSDSRFALPTYRCVVSFFGKALIAALASRAASRRITAANLRLATLDAALRSIARVSPRPTCASAVPAGT